MLGPLRMCSEPAATSRFRAGRNCYDSYLTWVDGIIVSDGAQSTIRSGSRQ